MYRKGEQEKQKSTGVNLTQQRVTTDLPVLSAQLITAPTGRPREMRNLAPEEPPRPAGKETCSSKNHFYLTNWAFVIQTQRKDISNVSIYHECPCVLSDTEIPDL